ncbi:calmodulin-binding transcription activator 2-like [Brassica napus]|uniref:calmodulin-binding transcription activator 2-like n=1 Tax=Brassica napus TaxID=3708 RepID=UPI0020793619|nr:calmodulin-binding transcription activator 2-like [Brassica napus]
MLEQELMHIVFVQYLEVKGNRISSSGIKENNSISLSGSTSVNIDSTANTSSTLSPLCEDDDSGIYSYLLALCLFRDIVLFTGYLALLKVLPLSFLGNRDGWIHGNKVKENDSQRLMGVPALDASFENPLARYQNLPYNLVLTQTNLSNVGLMSEEGHLRNPLQNQGNI